MLFASPLRIRCMTLWHLHTCSRTDSKRRAHVWIAADLEHASRQASKTLKLLRIHGVPAEKANITRAMAAQVNSVRDLGMKWHTQERQTCHSFYKTSWKEQWQIYNYIPRHPSFDRSPRFNLTVAQTNWLPTFRCHPGLERQPYLEVERDPADVAAHGALGKWCVMANIQKR